MKPEKQQLIHDLLADGDHGGQTLSAAMSALRRRRQWRTARQTLALIALVAMTAWLVGQNTQHPTATHPAPALAKLAPPQPAHSLTDAELLALFPNTPVALATLPNGKKLLIFPRPADQARYVNRL
jgi:hypothetical protein